MRVYIYWVTISQLFCHDHHKMSQITKMYIDFIIIIYKYIFLTNDEVEMSHELFSD